MKIEKDKCYQYTSSAGITFLVKALKNKENDNLSAAADNRWLGVCVKCSDSNYMKPGYTGLFGLREYWKEVNIDEHHNIKSIYDNLKDLLTF